MASKDITKVALACTAVVGLVVIYYLYTKRSKSQDADKRQGPKTKESSPVKKPQTQNEEKQGSSVAEKKPEPSPSKPKPESKIPQKIQSKPQGVVKPSLSEGSPAVAKNESIPNHDVSQAGGEKIKSQTTEIQNDEPFKILELSAEQPKKEIVSSAAEKTKEPSPPLVQPIQQPASSQQQLIQQPVSQQQVVSSQQQPVSQQQTASTQQQQQPVLHQTPSVQQQQPVQQPVQQSDRPVYDANDSDEVSIKSEASITLSSPSSQQTNTPSTGSPAVHNGGTESSVSNDQNGIEVSPQASSESQLDVERITKALQRATSSPNNIDKETVDTLVMLLRQKDLALLQTSLDCIVRCGAFSQNQSLLRESGCIQELTLLLQIHAVAARTGSQASQNLLGSLNNAIINLCMDIQNQARLEVCIPVLIDLITYEKSPEDVQLMSLKSLTNLSTTPSYHDQYIVAIPRLYSMMDGINSSIRLQAVKVLVNLSCNPEIIPDLLESKTPQSLLKCLEPQTDSILLLRVVTLLVNLVSCVKEGKITDEQLPVLDNPDNEGSIYKMLFGDNQTELKMRIQSLTRHSTDNVSKQAIRLVEYIQ